MRSTRLLARTAFAAGLVTPAAASANGAYPDGLGILLPADTSSHQVTLATNFGLIRSGDDGQSWQWGCEQPATSGANLYSLGPSPTNRIYALSGVGLASSNDEGCTWGLAGGKLSSIFPTDYFADPNDGQHVLAIGKDYTVSPPTDGVFVSVDGATTFSTTLYTGPSGATLRGVEIAQGAPQTIVITMFPGGLGGLPSLVRSTNGGGTWTTVDLGASLGPLQDLRIITIDPANPLRVFLRAIGVSTERLAIVDFALDGGAPATRAPIEVTGRLTGWLNRTDGTVIVSGLDGNGKGVGFQSTDSALTFQPWPASGVLPALRALAERSGVLYGAADDLGADGFALGISADDGATWTPLLKYSQVQRTIACATAQCLMTCQYEISIGVFGPSVCESPPDEAGPTAFDDDAGLDATSEGASAQRGADAALADSREDAPVEAPPSTGEPEPPSQTRAVGGCALAHVRGQGREGALLFSVATFVGGWVARRMRRRGLC